MVDIVLKRGDDRGERGRRTVSEGGGGETEMNGQEGQDEGRTGKWE